MREPDAREWRRLVVDRAARERRELPLDVVDELASHLAEEEAAAAARGLAPDEARRRALEILNAASLLELSGRPRARHAPLVGRGPGLLSDVRFAIRRLRQSPGFTVTALLTLSIGIGANTAMFTLLHAVLLRSLPVAHADRLYKLGDDYRCCPTETLQNSWSVFSYPFYLDVRDRSDAFEEVAAADTLRHDLSVRRPGGVDAAEAFTGEFVSGNYFTTLGVTAFAGRLFGEGDDHAGAPPIVVASYAAWQKAGLDRSAIGRPLIISGVTVTLAGVAPPEFFGDRLESHPPDFWLPLSVEPTFMRESTLLETRSAGWLYILGRFRPGRSVAQVQAELTAALRNYLRVPGSVNHEDDRARIESQVVRVVPGGGGINAIRRNYEQGLFLLFAASASVLLIACANLANLLLVRGIAQRTAIAVEMAIGASRWQIVRRQLTEAIVVSLGGGASGLIIAVIASRGILAIAFRGTPGVPIVPTPSLTVLLFTLGVSLATGVLFGAAPAWLSAQSDPADALRETTRAVVGANASQRALVVLQSAAAVVLITIAALLSQSLRMIEREPYGFQPEGRLVVQVDPQSAGYTQPRLDALYQRLEDRLSRVPGVVSASLSLYTAQQGDIWGARVFLEGAKGPFPALWDRVGARYFETVGTPIVRGRSLSEQDTERSRLVAVVNETFARRYFPDQDPIGRHFGKNDRGHGNDFEIVGVASDAKYLDASQPVTPMFFVPLAQPVVYSGLFNKIEESSRYIGSIELYVRGDPDSMTGPVRAALADVDPNLAPKSMTSFPEMIRIAGRQRALTVRLSDAFGAVALLLAAVGLYGVTAYRVSRRKREIALRMALGATRPQVAALVVGGACAQTAAGLVIGVPLAIVAAHVLRAQLFGVSPFDVRILAASAALVAFCGLAASVWPARCASRTAPMDALRQS